MSDPFNYQRMVLESLRDVVRRALEKAAETGMVGEHHFYISFDTRAPEVAIPETLAARYPERMTIVLQHQYRDLEVEPDRFSVSLVFSGIQHHLEIPFSAVTSFTDPAVPFALNFELPEPEEEDPDEERAR